VLVLKNGAGVGGGGGRAGDYGITTAHTHGREQRDGPLGKDSERRRWDAVRRKKVDT